MTTPAEDLRDAWADLLRRRSAFAGTLTIYGALIERWAERPAEAPPLDWSRARCRACWAEGTPLLVTARPSLDPADLEASLSFALDLVAEARPDAGEGLQRLAEGWDAGTVTQASLLPAGGRVGTLDEAVDLDPDVLAFLVVATLRPRLDAFFADCRAHLGDGDWELGVCPFCGAPPAFADVTEDGRRRLACHVCGGGWTFPRLRCPFCGDAETRNLGRLDFEAGADQGYFVSTCASCRGYIKELDRRARWNGGPALVEDWGSPHFDVACGRAGFLRPLAPVILGARPS